MYLNGYRRTLPTVFKGLSNTAAAAKILELMANSNEKRLFPSVKAAQMILESRFGTSELIQFACNCFGMKTMLSGNNWAGSRWDGTSKYSKVTQEQKADGTAYNVTADFRLYPCIEDSIADHSAYLLGAKKGNALRYDGIQNCKNYKEQIQLIKDGGYATDINYVDKVCSVITKFGLDKYDLLIPKTSISALSFTPYTVRVTASVLNIRKGPGTNYAINSSIKDKGVYTIVEEASGAGAKMWGKLKSGVGWISLDFAVRQ